MGSFLPIFKPWGFTYPLPQPDGAVIHVAFIRKGGKSSHHFHELMVNGFFVIVGKLKISQENGPDVILKGKLDWEKPDHSWIGVETKSFHGFEALENTIVVEHYGRVDIKRMRTPT